ncbi:SGNH/GDSL hydrolase family protein [Clostridium felsineum]|uniref:Uncharacterized protein n=1 Tax=Clostridium felsineum TaxID=36839 RepID=A0A1S8LSB8_9CLOT|nr:SGNH/GDSL hydrolase family protein [Clostridium felsineum]URZ04774.1 hypothetical protein CLROS_000890 [Clostridium felsineum]URZ09815.1 hypothetical protein CROST_005140 [Clostridium felsineum]
MELEVYKHRSGMPKLIQALNKGQVTLGFIGGSITDGEPHKRWPEYIVGWFEKNFPQVRLYVENAAIGATGSDLGVFRVDRDIIERKCDVVFVEYAVNDNDETSEKRMRTREGLIRKILKQKMDVIITYTYCQDMYESLMKDKLPNTVEEFEKIAKYYNISSVFMGLYALNQVKEGMMRWEEWLPDGLHPDERGSSVYGESVAKFLKEELIDKTSLEKAPYGENLPLSLNKNNWEHTHFVPLEDIKLKGPWCIRRGRSNNMIPQLLETAAVGAKLSFQFKGRGMSIACDFGRTSSEFRYRLDKGEWRETKRERPDWVQDQGWFKLENLYDSIENKEHTFELEVVHGKGEYCKGTNFRLIFVGVID